MLRSLIRKIFMVLLMIAAPIISFICLYEYANIQYFGKAPAFPLGKWPELRGVSYESEMLYIGLIFFVLAVLSYVSLLIKALFRLLIIAAILAAVYILTRYF